MRSYLYIDGIFYYKGKSVNKELVFTRLRDGSAMIYTKDGLNLTKKFLYYHMAKIGVEGIL